MQREPAAAAGPAEPLRTRRPTADALMAPCRLPSSDLHPFVFISRFPINAGPADASRAEGGAAFRRLSDESGHATPAWRRCTCTAAAMCSAEVPQGQRRSSLSRIRGLPVG